MIGIYGGTFDPVHFGHLRPAFEILQTLGLSQVRFIPCGVPPHREVPRATARHRVAMLQAAIVGVPGFTCDDREVRRSGPSYMVDTLRSLNADLPGESLCLILGMDAFAAFHTWHQWQEILNYCNLLVMQRPDFEPEKVIKATPLAELVDARRVDDIAVFLRECPGKLIFHPVTQLDISSTRIRGMFAEHGNPKFLMPERVIELIEQECIYQ